MRLSYAACGQPFCQRVVVIRSVTMLVPSATRAPAIRGPAVGRSKRWLGRAYQGERTTFLSTAQSWQGSLILFHRRPPPAKRPTGVALDCFVHLRAMDRQRKRG